MAVTQCDLYGSESYLLLGSHKAEVGARIDTTFVELRGQILKRAPKLALQRIVQEHAFNDIGGSLQFGTASRQGFILKLWMRPALAGEPALEFSFLGINIDEEVGQVGPYRIGMISTL
jgi:hypothetical protein